MSLKITALGDGFYDERRELDPNIGGGTFTVEPCDGVVVELPSGKSVTLVSMMGDNLLVRTEGGSLTLSHLSNGEFRLGVGADGANAQSGGSDAFIFYMYNLLQFDSIREADDDQDLKIKNALLDKMDEHWQKMSRYEREVLVPRSQERLSTSKKSEQFLGLVFNNGYKCRVVKSPDRSGLASVTGSPDLVRRAIFPDLVRRAIFVIDCMTGEVLKNHDGSVTFTLLDVEQWPVRRFETPKTIDEFMRKYTT